MRRLVLALTLALPWLPLAGCSSDDDGGDGATGSLRVEIDGLPVGVAGVVEVAGPGGYNRSLTVATTLTSLAPGSYVVTGADAADGSDVYVATVNGSPATVTAGATATVTVDYAITGALVLGYEVVTSALDFPLALTAPTGDSRLFIAEKSGRVRVVKNGTLLTAPFLDISTLVSTGNEQGLLGLAFDPQYAVNGRFFVSYTNVDGSNVLASYTRSTGNPDVAAPASAAIRLTVPQPFSNHNGGHIVFGPDGFLYMGIGDGGSGGDPQGNGQDPSDLLGSTLRLDVSAATGYTIPPSNPFVNVAGRRGELWDLGLRNPWRFSFDRQTGDLYIADVGQSDREEVNVARQLGGGGKGLNYGWAITEGTTCFVGSNCNRTGLTDPVLEYTHANGCSITGGHVYRGSAIPELAGTYFYSDFCSGWVRSFRFVNGVATAQTSWSALDTGRNVVSFGEDAAGELYVLTSDGTVSRIVAR
jgi:glucose/arabinose dehydrogenase